MNLAKRVLSEPGVAVAEGTPLPTPDEKDGGKLNLTIHLRKIPLLAELTEDEMARVKADLRLRQYAKRDIVLQKGGEGDSLLFLLSGQLQVVDITEDGRAVGLRMLSPGDFFGEIAVINGSPRSASVVALTPVLIALLPRATALYLFANSPSVANQMLRFLAAKVQRDSEFRALLSIHNTSKRIYNFVPRILLREKKSEGETGRGRESADPPGHREHDQYEPRNGYAHTADRWRNRELSLALPRLYQRQH
jgi:CRP/FNR family cyclic AMP-dependent transcriptional regulator